MAKTGDVLELAIWLDGTETPGMVRQWKHDSAYMIARSSGPQVAKISPVEFEIKRPGDDRVPPVPDDISGPDVRLLVASAYIIAFETVPEGAGFIAELDPKDLKRMRKITRKTHRDNNPGAPRLSDAVCDELIRRVGPGAALGALREAVDGGMVH